MRHIIRTMNNMLILRINQRLATLGISAQAASKRATGAKDTLRKILDGTTKNPRIDTIEKLANVLETTPEWLMAKTDDASLNAAGEQQRISQTYSAEAAESGQDVPVLGTAAGSHLRGAFQLMGGYVDMVPRPPALRGAKDIYALYIEGESMHPRYSPGDLIFVHPHTPAVQGDPVVIQSQITDADPVEATIGILDRRTEKSIVIKKFNPPREIEINRATVRKIHKVLTTNELFGV